MPYCGDVDVCIMNESLKCAMSTRRFAPCWMWIIEACESAASSLCVECVENVTAFSARAGCSDEIAWYPS